jgi:hypothetical protein
LDRDALLREVNHGESYSWDLIPLPEMLDVFDSIPLNEARGRMPTTMSIVFEDFGPPR